MVSSEVCWAAHDAMDITSVRPRQVAALEAAQVAQGQINIVVPDSSKSFSAREPFVRWHWQNLNDRRGKEGSGLRHGRCWFNFRRQRSINVEWSMLTALCGVQFDIDDEDATFMVAVPLLFSLFLSFSVNWWLIAKLAPRRPLTYYPDTIVIDERTCGIRVHSGTVWINPWSKKNETNRSDSWWVRGVSLNINPFEWKFMRHEVRMADGAWAFMPQRYIDPKPEAESIAYPYRYILKSGAVQDRTATVTVERRAWRPRCLRWTSLFEMVRTVIDVRFSDEVGERTGSWKGGTIGCGYDLRPDETAEQCLRRMELERKF